MTIKLTCPPDLDLAGLMALPSSIIDPVEAYGEQFATLELCIDLSSVRFIRPVGLAGVYGIVKSSPEKNFAVILPTQPNAHRYAQRMGLYDTLDIFLKKDFISHEAGNRFKELTVIPHGEQARSSYVDKLCSEIVSVIAPDSEEIKNLLMFCMGELINNVVQHSQSSGAICAQYYPAKGEVAVAIVDHGRGILAGLMDNPAHQGLANACEALECAVQPDTSGTFNQPSTPYQIDVNSGNGLYYLRKIIEKTYGFLDIWSHEGHYFQDGADKSVTKQVRKFGGTLVSFSFKRDFAYSLAELLRDIRKEDIGTAPALGTMDINFSE